MKLFKNKKFIFSMISLFFAISETVAASVTVEDYTAEFNHGFYHLKDKNTHTYKNYILHYELVKAPKVCEIFFDGHPVPKDPQVDKDLVSYSAHLPKLVKIYGQKAPEIKKIVTEVEARTEKIFGQHINAKVLLAPSVSQTDAVTTGNNVTKGAVVALNMRVMANYSNDELRIVLAHELFHVLQHQIERDHSNSEMIAGNLYSEGWATYGSSLIYPGFADWKYISYFNKDNKQFLRFQTERKAIIHNLFKDWNTRSERKFDKYFSADVAASHPFEPRSGYYIGYIAAKKMAEQNSPVKVALIKYQDFKKQIKPLLEKMSTSQA